LTGIKVVGGTLPDPSAETNPDFVMRVWIIMLLALSNAVFAEERDSAGDALAGHAAEARQWASAKDPFRRALFLEPVAIESANVGLDCGHRKARRPESIAGTGHVILLETRETVPRRIRFFAAPGEVETLEKAREAALLFVRSRIPELDFTEIAARSFDWCR